MSGKGHRRGRLAHNAPEKRDLARSALAFGRAGGCAAGCANCRYWRLCSGGDIGAEEGGEHGQGGSAEGTR